jgi:hypothetical protein
MMTKLILSLLAKDLEITLAFYQRLGFCRSGGSCESGWLEVMRDNAILQFHHETSAGMPPEPIMSGTIYLHIDDLECVASAARGHVSFEWGPEAMEYGNVEFAVRDPNGYLVAFSAPAPS